MMVGLPLLVWPISKMPYFDMMERGKRENVQGRKKKKKKKRDK
jgi:hypothetical protein